MCVSFPLSSPLPHSFSPSECPPSPLFSPLSLHLPVETISSVFGLSICVERQSRGQKVQQEEKETKGHLIYFPF